MYMWIAVIVHGIEKEPTNCHNPTNNPKQLKTTFVGVVLLSVSNYLKSAKQAYMLRNRVAQLGIS